MHERGAGVRRDRRFRDICGVTPSEATPRHSRAPVIVTVRATLLIGFSAPVEVNMTLGSRMNGTAKPPAEPVPIDIARSDWGER